MTRKHFVSLAREIGRIQNPDARAAASFAVQCACLEHNPRFDSGTFHKAVEAEAKAQAEEAARNLRPPVVTAEYPAQTV